MNAYKFLEPGRVSPFSGFHWPEGDWVEAHAADACRGGIHACRPQDLPFWMTGELWGIELEGEILKGERKVVAPRGRLTGRIEGWSDELLAGFAGFCLERTRKRVGYVPILAGFVTDVDRFRVQGRWPMAGFAAARAAERRDGPEAYDEERAVQASWLSDRLGLSR